MSCNVRLMSDCLPKLRRLWVEEMQAWPEGRVCALTDLHAEVWDRSENLALNRQATKSFERLLTAR